MMESRLSKRQVMALLKREFGNVIFVAAYDTTEMTQWCEQEFGDQAVVKNSGFHWVEAAKWAYWFEHGESQFCFRDHGDADAFTSEWINRRPELFVSVHRTPFWRREARVW
jgi:hypothetical protein